MWLIDESCIELILKRINKEKHTRKQKKKLAKAEIEALQQLTKRGAVVPQTCKGRITIVLDVKGFIEERIKILHDANNVNVPRNLVNTTMNDFNTPNK